MTLQDLRDTRVWRSVFRGGSGATNLRRSMAIQQNVFLHLASVKARKRALEFSVTWLEKQPIVLTSDKTGHNNSLLVIRMTTIVKIRGIFHHNGSQVVVGHTRPRRPNNWLRRRGRSEEHTS